MPRSIRVARNNATGDNAIAFIGGNAWAVNDLLESVQSVEGCNVECITLHVCNSFH